MTWKPFDFPGSIVSIVLDRIGSIVLDQFGSHSGHLRGHGAPWTFSTCESRNMQATPQTEGEEVKLIFELLDADHSGKIDVDELKRVLLSLSSWDEKQVEALIDQFDKNKDGELSIVEFWSWVNGH